MLELRAAVRALIATPIVSLVAVASLAAGIGANTAIFSILDRLLLRDLPVKAPDRLAALTDSIGNTWWTNAQWEEIRDRPWLADGAIASSSIQRFDVSTSGQTDFIGGLYVSGGFFEVLGVGAVLGRTFTTSDDRRGGGADGPVAVISYPFWQRFFGGAADVVGRTITLNRVPFTIVGVAPPGFFGLTVGSAPDVVVPCGTEALMSGEESLLDRRDSQWLNVTVRLEAGQTLDRATATIRAVQTQIRQATMPAGLSAARAKRYLTRPFGFRSAARGLSGSAGLPGPRGRYRTPLLVLLVTGSALLLVACANIANLGLLRATGRRHELAVRAALGASKLRLARPLFLESLLLAGVGTLCGLVVARWGAKLLVAGLSTTVAHVALDVTLDWRVLAFTAALSALTVILFGTAPALRAAQARPREALASKAGATTGAGRLTVSGALVVAQVALGLVLVASAGLFTRTFATLARLDTGFDRDPVLVVELPKRQGDLEPGWWQAQVERVMRTVRDVPGVRSAAASPVTPVSGYTADRTVEIVGEPEVDDARAYQNAVTPGWFATYGTPLVVGRDFTDRDVGSAPPVAIVNRAFVRRFLADKDPLGRLIQQSPTPLTIVGVVEDATYRALREPVMPTVYLPYAQSALPEEFRGTSISIRSAGPPAATLVRPVAAALKAADGALSFTIRPLAEQVGATLAQERLVASVSAFFGGLALLLATLGLYGVTAYGVSRRRRELGIRMALGGTPAGVVRLVLGRVAWLVGGGVAVGCLGGYWAARFVRTLVFGLDPRDPLTFVVAAAMLAATGLIAGAVPAWRAVRSSPTAALRSL